MDVDEANDWPDGLPLWTARVLLRVKEHLEGGMDEEALAYVDNRLEHLFLQTAEYWSGYERWLSGLDGEQRADCAAAKAAKRSATSLDRWKRQKRLTRVS